MKNDLISPEYIIVIPVLAKAGNTGTQEKFLITEVYMKFFAEEATTLKKYSFCFRYFPGFPCSPPSRGRDDDREGLNCSIFCAFTTPR